MKYSKLLFIIGIYITSKLVTASCDLDGLFNTKILKNPKQVQNILEKNNFKKQFLTTPDNVKLCTLFLDKTQQNIPIKGTIIYCAGFYPGTKEGMTTFYAMLADQPYNVLFFDARGHHESDGSLFSYSNLKQYGRSEYLDIATMLNFVHEYNQEHHINQNIIIHGICSGAFHAVKSYDYLKKQEHPVVNNIVGIVFDSGWNRINEIVEPIITIEVQQRLTNTLFSWLISPLTYIIQSAYALIFKSSHAQVEPLQNNIGSVSCPILFIHSPADTHITLDQVRPLIQRCTKATCWLPEIESHASYHLKQQKAYRQKLIEFFECLP